MGDGELVQQLIPKEPNERKLKWRVWVPCEPWSVEAAAALPTPNTSVRFNRMRTARLRLRLSGGVVCVGQTLRLRYVTTTDDVRWTT